MARCLAFASASALAVAACGKGTSNSANNASADAAAPAAETAEAPDRPSGPDAELPRELAMTAQMLSKQLPLRHQGPQGPVSISAIEARGTELIHRIDYPGDLSQGVFDQLAAQLPARMCDASSQLRQMLLRGGTLTYVMRDKDGEEFTTTVNRC